MQFQLIMLSKIFSQINNNIIFDNFSTEMTKLDSMNWILWQLGLVVDFFTKNNSKIINKVLSQYLLGFLGHLKLVWFIKQGRLLNRLPLVPPHV